MCYVYVLANQVFNRMLKGQFPPGNVVDKGICQNQDHNVVGIHCHVDLALICME